MPESDLFLQTIDAVYAGGLDTALMPEALKATSFLLGSVGATLEVISKPQKRPIGFWSAGLPDVSRAQYIEHFASLNPRIPLTLGQRAGDVAWDRQLFDEGQMKRDPFYSEFLPQLGLRYFVSIVLEQSADTLAVVAVQRSRKQGHVEKREINLMRRLYPHYQRAYDLAMRLKGASDRSGLLENAVEWLTDGVSLLRADGKIVYANDAMLSFAQRGDGIRIVGGTLELAGHEARRSFDTALGALARLGNSSADGQATDFPVMRSGGAPAYVVSMRPLARANNRTMHTDADVMVLVRDPLSPNQARTQILRELFRLTNAEAHLAQALCNGVTTRVYATERRVTLNTVYSHLKQIREKTGCRSVPELIHKFGEWNVPLRLS
jgi:DNA-binding CsgD family transcriptional regulator